MNAEPKDIAIAGHQQTAHEPPLASLVCREESLMKLELTLEEVRVLDVAMEYIKKHKDVAVKIYAGYEDDIKTVNAIGGMLRAAYLHEKQKS